MAKPEYGQIKLYRPSQVDWGVAEKDLNEFVLQGWEVIVVVGPGGYGGEVPTFVLRYRLGAIGARDC